MPFIKLSAIQQFTVKEYKGYSWKMWDITNNKMLKSDSWQQGYRKMHTLETEQGTLDVSNSQLGEMLAGVVSNGMANVIGKSFNVKTNGKTGKEIRYFINPVMGKAKEAVEMQAPEELPPEALMF